jgi:hypothetical protein
LTRWARFGCTSAKRRTSGKRTEELNAGAPREELRATRIFLALLLAALALRLYFFVGITGSRDEENELVNSLRGIENFPHSTWPSYNRLVLVVPKLLIYRLMELGDWSSGLYTWVASGGCIVLAYAIGARLFNSTAGLVAAGLMACSAFDIASASYAWGTDIVLTFWMGVAVLTALRYREQPTVLRWLAAGFAVWLAYRTKTNGVLILLPLLLLFVRNRRSGFFFALLAIGLLAADTALVYWLSGHPLLDVESNYRLVESSVRPFRGWPDFAEAIKTFAGGKEREFGFFPHLLPFLAVAGLFVLRGTDRERHALVFVLAWIGIPLAFLMLLPAGWDWQEEKLLIFAHQMVRYYHVVILPIAVLAGAVGEKLFALFGGRARVPLLIAAAVLCLDAVGRGAEQAQVGLNHRAWMETMTRAVATLPPGATVLVDQGTDIWINFKHRELKERYKVIRINAEHESDIRNQIGMAVAEPGPVYLLVGGPRGRETPDGWRLRRAMIPDEYGVETIWKEAPAEGTRFDGYYGERGPSEMLRMETGRPPNG